MRGELQSNKNVCIYRSKKIKLLCVHSDSGFHTYYIHTKFSLFGAVIFDI